MSIDSKIDYCRCGQLRHIDNACPVCAILGTELAPNKGVKMTTHLKQVSTEIVREEAAKEAR